MHPLTTAGAPKWAKIQKGFKACYWAVTIWAKVPDYIPRH
jgi:hypothetical protein